MIENKKTREFEQRLNVISLIILAPMLKMDCKKETKKTQETQPRDGGKNPGWQRIMRFRKLIKQVMKGDRFGIGVKQSQTIGLAEDHMSDVFFKRGRE